MNAPPSSTDSVDRDDATVTLPGLRILVDVVVFRVRRLEMANLLGVAAIAFALRLPGADIAGRLGFAALLNVLVYTTNDYCDRHTDLSAGSRPPDKTRFLLAHARQAVVVQWLLFAALAAVAWLWNREWLGALLVSSGVCWVYSKWLSRRPVVDLAAMLVWGAAMASVGTPLGAPDGWLLVGQLGLFAVVSGCIQVVRDRDEDAIAGLRTTAVVLGVNRVVWITRWTVVASALYAGMLVHPVAGGLVLALLFVPFWPERASRFWNFARAILGAAFLFECAVVWQRAGT